MSAPFHPGDPSSILRELEQLADPQYKAFNESLLPGVETTYGIRLPALRALAKKILRSGPEEFLSSSHNGSYEEIQLRGLVIGELKVPWGEKQPWVEEFLPLIDNWAVCDTFCGSLKPLSAQDAESLWRYLLPFYTHKGEFFARFAVVTQLAHFIDQDHLADSLVLLQKVDHPGYYAKMAVAWALSMWYVSFPKELETLLSQRSLSPWIQNKTIQKIRESRRITKEAKDSLLVYKL